MMYLEEMEQVAAAVAELFILVLKIPYQELLYLQKEEMAGIRK